MEVLEEGKKWSINYRCNGIGFPGGGCGALLKIEAEDIYAIIKNIDEETDEFMYSKSDYCYTFKCPCCNIETEICEKELPINVKRQALSRLQKSVKDIRVTKNGRMYL